MNLWRGSERPFVIGHRGAAGVAPENTLASLEAAVEAGVDIVEFDLQPDLRLGHTPGEPAPDAISVDDALDYLRAARAGVQLDLKLPGYEADALAAVRRHGLEERALFSTAWPATMRELARLAPAMPRAIGYPRDQYRVSSLPWPPVAGRAGAAAGRAGHAPPRAAADQADGRDGARAAPHALHGDRRQDRPFAPACRCSRGRPTIPPRSGA